MATYLRRDNIRNSVGSNLFVPLKQYGVSGTNKFEPTPAGLKVKPNILNLITHEKI